MPRVVFFRPSAYQGGRAPVNVYCDLTKLATIRKGTYFEIALSPGAHVCSTEMQEVRLSGNSENVFKPEELTLEVKSGPKQWVSVRFKSVGLTHVTVRLTPEDLAEAEKEMKHVQPVKPEDQTVRSIKRTPPDRPAIKYLLELNIMSKSGNY